MRARLRHIADIQEKLQELEDYNPGLDENGYPGEQPGKHAKNWMVLKAFVGFPVD